MQRRTSDDLFLAVAHPVRRQVLESLATVDELAFPALVAQSGLSQSALSQHLRVLRECKLIVERKQGRQRFYRITPEPLLEVIQWMHSFEFLWHSRLARLTQFLESKDQAHENPDPEDLSTAS